MAGLDPAIHAPAAPQQIASATVNDHHSRPTVPAPIAGSAAGGGPPRRRRASNLWRCRSDVHARVGYLSDGFNLFSHSRKLHDDAVAIVIHYPIIAFICLCLQLFPTLMHKRDGDLVARAKAIFDQEAANLHGMPIVSCPSEIQYIVLETIGLRMISELADEADRLRKKIALKNTLQGITTFLILSSTMAYIALFVCDNFTQLYLPDAQKISSSPQGFAPAYGYRMMDTGAVARPSNQGAVTP